ncbi:MAG TPA: hypothetical protein VMX13_14060 [Sedimentisphaerales bacterium]|nr:hypothetical protein [Sedimentisphaerales bacterium]
MKTQKATMQFHVLILSLWVFFNAHLPTSLCQDYWYKPAEPPKGASAEEIANTNRFNQELRLAKEAPDRNSKVEHMAKALSYGPNHPDNIKIEFEMAVAMSQHWDPENPQPMRREEALEIYKRILATYNHMDYYSPEPVNRSSCKQFMVPESAVHLACLYRGLRRDTPKARETLHFGMECMQKTYERRKSDWANAQPPREPKPNDRFGGPFKRAKWESRMAHWQKRKKAAEAGDVFSKLEMETAKAAVRQYGYTFGQRQKGMQVALAMGEIIRDFPDTPMAKIAAGHIERAKEMSISEAEEEFMSLEDLYERPSTQPKPAPKSVFIPDVRSALKDGTPFVFALAPGERINCHQNLDCQEAYKMLMELGKGDIAWNGSLLTVRKAKALTPAQESHRPLKCTPGRWCNWDTLPEKVELPYSLLVVTNEDADYFVQIVKIEPEGITITYRKLRSGQVEGYLPTP